MKINYIVTLFFILILAISKEFFILNAELLVAFCFIAFVYVISAYFRDSIKESLEEKAVTLQKEFDQYFSVEKQQLSSLISYYTRQLDFLPKLEGFYLLLKDLHEVFILNASISLKNYYINYVKYILLEIRTGEESLYKNIHNYFVLKSYLSNVHFVKLVFMFHKKFPSLLYKKYFLKGLKTIS